MAWLGNKKIDFAYWKGQWVSLDRILHPGRAIYYKHPSGKILITDIITQGSIVIAQSHPLYAELEVRTLQSMANSRMIENLDYTRADLSLKINTIGIIQNYFGIQTHGDLRFDLSFKGKIADIESIPVKAKPMIFIIPALDGSVILADSIPTLSELLIANTIKLDAILNAVEYLEPTTAKLRTGLDINAVPFVITPSIYTFFENDASGYTYQIFALNYITEEEQGGLTYTMEAVYEGE